MPMKNATGTNRTGKVFPVACYSKNPVHSQGIFLGDIPIRFALPLLLLEFSTIFFLNSTAHCFLSRLGFPRVVTQLLVGIVLGPSVLGNSTQFGKLMFPERGLYLLENISLIALILFLFSIGARSDFDLLRRPTRRAVIIGVVGAVLPFTFALTLFYTMRSSFPVELQHTTLFFELAVRFSLSSFPVTADALAERELLSADLGRIAMSASMVTDLSVWFLKILFTATMLIARAKNPVTAVEIIASFMIFVVLLFLVVRPAVIWVIHNKTPPGELIGEGLFVGLVIMALLSALTTEVLGFRFMLGPVMLGLILPGGMPVGLTLTEHLDSFFTSMFLPVYAVLAGYRINLTEIANANRWTVVELLPVVCFVGKMVGTIGAALAYKLPLRDAFCLGLMLNIKGVIEIAFINNWGGAQKGPAVHRPILILQLLIITSIVTPLIKCLYNPSTRFMTTKHRTVEHAKHNSEFRMLACLHSEEHVAPILDALGAIGPSPTNPTALYVLHLSDLSGRASSSLRKYKRPRNRSAFNAADRIVNAFRYFEQNGGYEPGSLSIHPYVSMCPYNTMHNDVCSLALSSKSRLIVLLFHKQSDGARETTKQSVQTVNRMVLDIAPCSVAILVDRSLPAGSTYTHTTSLFQRIVVYFLGGPDDREALAVGSRVGLTHNVQLTVVRILLRSDEALNRRHEQDERFIEGVMKQHLGNERTIFMERSVDDGEGTSAIISSMSEKFDLAIVGRRKQQEQSPLTSGLVEWSECTELGVLGDMLVSLDVDKVSIMVVQQQAWAGSNETTVEVAEITRDNGAVARSREGSIEHLIHPRSF